MNNIACYIRVSTDKSDQQNSLEHQRAMLESKYSESNITMYSDTGTGTSFNRKGFKQLLYDAGLNMRKLKDGRITFEADVIREPLFKEIVVLSYSRFSRNIAIIDILRTLWDYKKVYVRFLDVNKCSNETSDMPYLQMLFTMAENEVAETSKRTKRGNQTTIIQNKIRNNSIFGWTFNRETNSLIADEEEKKVVEFIFQTALTNGLKLTAKIVNEKGYRTKKGNLWTDSTIKTLITNPKYKGYNVRNKYTSENLFTESKVKYVPKKDWVIKKNDTIEPLVSEELWDSVQYALHQRCIAGNKGQNARIYDTRGKIKCRCGASYNRAVTTTVASRPLAQHYLICGNKKKYTKSYCNSENITVGMLDSFIEEQRKNYYKNVQLQIQIKIIQLQEDMVKVNNSDVIDIKNKEAELKKLKSKMERLIDTFLSSSETMQHIVEKKINELESKIKVIEADINRCKSINIDKEKHKRDIVNKIAKLKLELNKAEGKELTRQEWLYKVNSIIIESKTKFRVVYNLD